jgi:hypothetical protein
MLLLCFTAQADNSSEPYFGTKRSQCQRSVHNVALLCKVLAASGGCANASLCTLVVIGCKVQLPLSTCTRNTSQQCITVFIRIHTYRALLHATLGDYARFYRCVGFATSIFDSMSAVRAMKIDAVKRGISNVEVPPPLAEETKYMLQVNKHILLKYAKMCTSPVVAVPLILIGFVGVL